jgi:hypothetical protein
MDELRSLTALVASGEVRAFAARANEAMRSIA